MKIRRRECGLHRTVWVTVGRGPVQQGEVGRWRVPEDCFEESHDELILRVGLRRTRTGTGAAQEQEQERERALGGSAVLRLSGVWEGAGGVWWGRRTKISQS